MNSYPSELIALKFMRALSKEDTDSMKELYAADIQFHDPVFSHLKGEEVIAMWEMLFGASKGRLKVEYSQIDSRANMVEVNWIATYPFGPKNRMVKNKICSLFTIENNKIIAQQDDFYFWKWSRMAFGQLGWSIGFTPYFRKKVQSKAKAKLQQYLEKKAKIE